MKPLHKNIFFRLTPLVIAINLAACGGETTSATPTTPPDTTPSKTDFNPTRDTPLNYLNYLRNFAGLTTLSTNSQLTDSALAHTKYMLDNNVQGHSETSGTPGFTGVSPQDRAITAGYKAPTVSEDISYNKATHTELLDDLMTAVYHRMGLLDFTKDEIGFGFEVRPVTTNGSLWSALTANLGFKALNDLCNSGGENITSGSYYTCNDGTTKISATTYDETLPKDLRSKSANLVVWPPANAVVPPSFYEESPDPLPECSVSGNPISVQVNPKFNDQYTLDAASFTLTEKSSGHQVEIIKTLSNLTDQPDPVAADWKGDRLEWFAAFPKERLQWGKTYTAKFNYTDGSTSSSKTWEFHTKALPENPLVITQDTTITGTSGKDFYVVIPPTNCKVKSTGYTSSGSYPQGTVTDLKIDAIDLQTYKVNAVGFTTLDITFTEADGQTTHSRKLTINF